MYTWLLCSPLNFQAYNLLMLLAAGGSEIFVCRGQLQQLVSCAALKAGLGCKAPIHECSVSCAARSHSFYLRLKVYAGRSVYRTQEFSAPARPKLDQEDTIGR